MSDIERDIELELPPRISPQYQAFPGIQEDIQYYLPDQHLIYDELEMHNNDEPQDLAYTPLLDLSHYDLKQ